jgi:hypothetical protein
MTLSATTTMVLRSVVEADPKTRLILVLAHANKGDPDLLKHLPKDADTLFDMKIGLGDADRKVREWIDRVYRKPKEWPPIGRGNLPLTTTFAKLFKLCTEQ